MSMSSSCQYPFAPRISAGWNVSRTLRRRSGSLTSSVLKPKRPVTIRMLAAPRPCRTSLRRPAPCRERAPRTRATPTSGRRVAAGGGRRGGARADRQNAGEDGTDENSEPHHQGYLLGRARVGAIPPLRSSNRLCDHRNDASVLQSRLTNRSRTPSGGTPRCERAMSGSNSRSSISSAVSALRASIMISLLR